MKPRPRAAGIGQRFLAAQHLHAATKFKEIRPGKLQVGIGLSDNAQGMLGDLGFGALNVTADPTFVPFPKIGDLSLRDTMDMHKLEQDKFFHVASIKGLTQGGTENLSDRGIRMRGGSPTRITRPLSIDL